MQARESALQVMNFSEADLDALIPDGELTNVYQAVLDHLVLRSRPSSNQVNNNNNDGGAGSDA